MSNTVIKIENLYKEYRLGVIGHGTLYRDIQSWWAKVKGKPDPNSLLGVANPHEGKDSILALNNINLEVENGEVLGIIGANGAGKSTLLKILSKVTTPTSGTIKYKGRLSSLLEVGTGFHFELTGRENIYLNGAINGMVRKDVSKKLDEIVDFAGVDKYLDTPVKRYSSGMHVRLGFAVAAHLEPDILVVDEVLAVGDAEFQKKAINKMQNISESQGRTVLFVSHNMESIRKLSDRTVMINNGTIFEIGETNAVISNYMTNFIQNNSLEVIYVEDKSMPLQITKIFTLNEKKEKSFQFGLSDQIKIEIHFIVRDNQTRTNIYMGIFKDGLPIFSTYDVDKNPQLYTNRKPGEYKANINLPRSLLKGGIYFLTFATQYESKVDDLAFEIIDNDRQNRNTSFISSVPGSIMVPINWEIDRIV